MRLKPTKTTLAILGGLLGVVILASGGVFYFISGQVSAVQAQVDHKRLELEDGERIADRRTAALAALEGDREQIQFLETGVSDQAYVPTLLRQIELLAANTQNQVVAVRPLVETKAPTKIQQRRDIEAAEKGGESKSGDGEEEEVPEPYTRLGIQISLVGRYTTAQQFVDRLTKFPKIISVNEMTIRPHKESGSNDDSGLLDVELKVTAFVMKQDGSSPVSNVTASVANNGGIN